MRGYVRSTLKSRRAVAIYVAAGAAFGALGARGLLVPLYALSIGADRFEVGALFSSATLAAALLSLPSGLLIDRIGARTMLLFSIVIGAGSQLAMAFTNSVLPLFIFQVAGGLGSGAQQASLFSAVTESVDEGRAGRAMGWLTFSMQAGFFLGPTVAGLALVVLDPRSSIAFTTVLYLLAIPGALATSGSRQSHRGFSLREPLRALFGQRAFLPVTIGLIATSLTWGTIGAFLPIFAKQALNLPSAQVGYMLALQAIANGIARIPGGRIVDRAKQRWPIVFTGVLVWVAASIVLGHLGGFWLPTAVLVLATPFMATAFVAIGVVFADLSSGSTRGVTMGVYGTVLFLGLSAGPLLFGPLVKTYGYAFGFTVCAAVGAILALVMAAYHVEPLRRRAGVAMPPASPGT